MTASGSQLTHLTDEEIAFAIADNGATQQALRKIHSQDAALARARADIPNPSPAELRGTRDGTAGLSPASMEADYMEAYKRARASTLEQQGNDAGYYLRPATIQDPNYQRGYRQGLQQREDVLSTTIRLKNEYLIAGGKLYGPFRPFLEKNASIQSEVNRRGCMSAIDNVGLVIMLVFIIGLVLLCAIGAMR